MARKKITETPVDESKPLTYEKWKVGDYVFCTRDPENTPGYGEITRIHLNEKSGIPCFTFYCEITKQFRLARFDRIVNKPTQDMLKAVKRSNKSRF